MSIIWNCIVVVVLGSYFLVKGMFWMLKGICNLFIPKSIRKNG